VRRGARSAWFDASKCAEIAIRRPPFPKATLGVKP
jgi:hypothetical protein